MKTNNENMKKNSSGIVKACGLPLLPYNFKPELKVGLNSKKVKELQFEIKWDPDLDFVEFDFDCLDDMTKSPLDWSWLAAVGAWRVLAFYSPWTAEEKKEKKIQYHKSIIKEYNNSKLYGGRRWVGFNNVLKDIGVLFFGGYNLEPSIIYHDGFEIVKIIRIKDSCSAYSSVEEACIDNRWDVHIVEESTLIEEDSHFNIIKLYNKINNFNYVDIFTEEHGYYFNDYWSQCEWCGGLYSNDDEGLQYVDRMGVICDDCLETRGWVYCREDRIWVNMDERVYPCEGCCCGCYYDSCPYYQEPEPDYNNSTGDPDLDSICNIRDRHGYSTGSTASALVVNYEEVDLDSAAGLALRASGLFCGLEIETSIEEVKNTGALDRIINKNNKIVQIKSDSSLDSGCGSEAFEFVTLKLFNALEPGSAGAVRDLVRDIEDAGFMPDSSCGGHMHFDLKGCISEENWVRFAYLVENTDTVVLRDLFGRSFNGYCDKLGSGVWAEALAKVKREDPWGEVLASLNSYSHGRFIRRTSRTVEVRLFAGVTCWEDIVERCGVVVKLLKYAEGRSFEELRRGYEEEEEEEDLW